MQRAPVRSPYTRLTPGTARPLIVLALTTIYALCFVAIKAGLPFTPPLRFAGLRAAIAGVTLLGLLAVLRRPLLPPLWSWPWIVSVGLTATTISFGAMFLSPGRTGAGIASVLGNTQPLLVPVLGLLIATLAFGAPIGVPEALGVGLTLTGIGALAWEEWRNKPAPQHTCADTVTPA